MKIKGLIVIVSMASALSACSQTDVKSIKLETREDSLAYAIGVLNYEGLSQQGLKLDALKMAKGMVEASEGNAIFNETIARGYYSSYMQDNEERMMKDRFKEVIEESEAFLEKNRSEEGVVVTESGLQYKVITMGTGPKPTAENKVRVHYRGTLIDGTPFDSSYDDGEPVEFNVRGVISGWTEGLQLMPVGSKFMFYIPSDLAYGSRGAGQDISPFAALIFEVELLDIVTF